MRPPLDPSHGAVAPTVLDEHFVPLDGLDLAAYARRGDACSAHHLVRYHWARRVLADRPEVRTILDLGCGAGYGSSLLARARPEAQILACDYDDAAVASARATYGHGSPPIEFRHGDVLRWEATIGREAFDAIVCFDVIEHVDHRELMMEEIVRHLSPSGALLLSTPCGHAEPELRPEWPAHKIEYAAANLYDFVGRYFRSVLRPDGEGWPHREVFDELAALGVDYLLRMNPIICRDPILVANPYR